MLLALAAKGILTRALSTVCATISKAGASAIVARVVQSPSPGLDAIATSTKPGFAGKKWLRFCWTVSVTSSPATKAAVGAPEGAVPQ
jgi:hypothetical protein